MSAFLSYALDKGGVLVHIDDVVKGAKCGCHCPRCHAPLYAKNAGEVREHHFAHAHGQECEGAYESSLHLLAKEVLQEAGCIMLPQSNSGAFPSGLVRIHNVEVEKWDKRYGFRPDMEGIMDNGERLLIEFLVSHKVDGKKRQSIVDNHLKCIEININFQALDRAQLKNFLTSSLDDRKWIVSTPPTPNSSGESFSHGRNPMYEKTRDMLKIIFDEGTITIHPYPTITNEVYNLRKLGYDVCEVNTSYRGFKTDLLLFRSKKDKKGYIAINIRGQKRREDFRYPPELRCIDIIFKSIGSEESTKRRLKEGDLIGDFGMTIEYYGFKKK